MKSWLRSYIPISQYTAITFQNNSNVKHEIVFVSFSMNQGVIIDMLQPPELQGEERGEASGPKKKSES